MKNLFEKVYGYMVVVEHADSKWGVLDLKGKEIVPFGKYDWIDGFDNGLARVKIGNEPSGMKNHNKWGIINEKGEEVIPPIYDEIWNFYNKNRHSTKVVKDGEERIVYFHDLNPALPPRGDERPACYFEEEDYGGHYGEYAGSYAQDVAGFDDDTINDAFEGDPEAYWNID